jgi:hypothetical protein
MPVPIENASTFQIMREIPMTKVYERYYASMNIENVTFSGGGSMELCLIAYCGTDENRNNCPDALNRAILTWQNRKTSLSHFTYWVRVPNSPKAEKLM